MIMTVSSFYKVILPQHRPLHQKLTFTTVTVEHYNQEYRTNAHRTKGPRACIKYRVKNIASNPYDIIVSSNISCAIQFGM